MSDAPRDQEAERQACLDAILSSPARRKLIIAGPGTGKTHTFREMLARQPENNLALTFINLLAENLAVALDNVADATTFHGYCRGLLHRMPVAGLTTRLNYYPPLILLQVQDLSLVEAAASSKEAIERAYQTLDVSDSTITSTIRSGDYYDAVGHLDSVYRVLRHLEANSDVVPQFSQIVVDEYQDFSRLEAEFIRVVSTHSPLLIVGDDDQALYLFKHASPAFIRELAAGEEFERFELPFCSRCTQVLVAATHTVIGRARSRGLLQGRIDKRYECFLPSKRAASQRYPKITHAHCTVERKGAHYAARYIENRIQVVPEEDIAEAEKEDEPTVLVIGPKHFVGPVFEHLGHNYRRIEYRPSSELEVHVTDGLRLLLLDGNSRLGWRILLYLDPIAQLDLLLRGALIDGGELGALVPAPYRERWLEIVELLRLVLNSEGLSGPEQALLEQATGRDLASLRREFGMNDDADQGVESEVASDSAPVEPRIVMTTLVGAKGLQAQHVFVLGFNDKHFPYSNANVSDEEVCQLLVALTRAKKSCTVISFGRFGEEWLSDSVFLGWLKPHLASVRVDKAYLAAS